MINLRCRVHNMAAAVAQWAAIQLKNESLSRKGSRSLFYTFVSSVWIFLGGVCCFLKCAPEQSQKNKEKERKSPCSFSVMLFFFLFVSVVENRSSGSWVVNCCPSHPSNQLTLITTHDFINSWHTHTHTRMCSEGSLFKITSVTMQQHYGVVCYRVQIESKFLTRLLFR